MDLIDKAEEIWERHKTEWMSRETLAASLNQRPSEVVTLAYREHCMRAKAAAVEIERKEQMAFDKQQAQLKERGKGPTERLEYRQQSMQKRGRRPRLPADGWDSHDDNEGDRESDESAIGTGNASSEEETEVRVIGSGKRKLEAAAAKKIVIVETGKRSGPVRKKQRVDERKGGRRPTPGLLLDDKEWEGIPVRLANREPTNAS